MFPRVTLTAVEGPHKGQELICPDQKVITIGRSQECNFTLCGPFEDMLISRRHCMLRVHPDGVEIRDLESRNGTYVNGKRLGFPTHGEGTTAFRRWLKDGDLIGVGTTLLRIQLQPDPTKAVHSDATEFISP